MALTREDIVRGLLKVKDVDVPDVGTFHVRSLSAKDADELRLLDGQEIAGERAMLVLVKSLVDDDGKRMFEDTETNLLSGALPVSAMLPLIEAVIGASGLEDVIEAFVEAQKGDGSSESA